MAPPFKVTDPAPTVMTTVANFGAKDWAIFGTSLAASMAFGYVVGAYRSHVVASPRL